MRRGKPSCKVVLQLLLNVWDMFYNYTTLGARAVADVKTNVDAPFSLTLCVDGIFQTH